MGKPIPDRKKSRWLLNGLGKDYEMFTTMMLRPPIPPYIEIVTLLESHSERHQLDTTYTSDGLYGQRVNKNKKNKGGGGTPSILKDMVFLKDTHLVQGNQINKMHEFKVQIILSDPTIWMKFIYVKCAINEIT